MMQKKIAVVGAGIYGVTIACKLAKKFNVDLIERSGDIFQEASSINQFRLHRGYHYPRSKETALSSLASIKPFINEYKSAVIGDTNTYYAISREKSRTSVKAYLEFLQDLNLEFKKIDTSLIESSKVDIKLKVNEQLLDISSLKKISNQNLKEAGVRLFLRREANKKMLEAYDQVIICTYSNINKLLDSKFQREYQFEICEKVILKLPQKFKKTSIVILDGPFMCIDPYGRSEYHLMGNVVHAIHSTNIGKFPIIPAKLRKYLNKGIIRNPENTKFKEFIDSACEFIPEVKGAVHIGSMFTVRTVLPNKDKSDERPTIVNRLNEKTFTVFSGKISNCVLAAEEISVTLLD